MNILRFDDPISPNEVAQHLKRMRKLSGLTLQQAADRRRINWRTIEAYESGRNLTKVCELIALFEAYGCTIIFKPPTRPTIKRRA